MNERIIPKNEPINPLVDVSKRRNVESPLYNIYDEFNGANQFAIMRTTDGGKYVKGGMLYFELNGVIIYTEIDNIIFVNRRDNSMVVRKDKSIAEQISPSDPETKQYILLMWISEDEPCQWQSMEGRKTIYEYIRDNIEIAQFDPDKSIILTDNIAFKDASTVTQFIKYLQNGNLVDEDEFDIEEYRIGEYYGT